MVQSFRNAAEWISKRNAHVKWVLKILVTLLFIYLVNRMITPRQLKGLFESLSVPHLVTATLLGFLGVAFQSLRWHRVLQCLDFRVGFTDALKTMLWGSLLGFVTPGRAGELLRGVGLDENRKADAVLASMLDRIYAVLFALLCGAAALSALALSGAMVESKLLYPLLGLTALGTILSLLLKFKSTLLQKNRAFRWLTGKFGHLPSALGSALGKRILFHTLAAHIVLLLQTAVLFDMFGYHDYLLTIPAIAQAYTFMIFMPFFVANAGVREYSMALFVGQCGSVSSMDIKAASTAVSTLVLFLNIFIPALAGLFWILLEKRKRKTAPQNTVSTPVRLLRESGYEE